MEPAEFQNYLTYQERMAKDIRSSLKLVKGRLHNAELVMYMKPPDFDPQEVKDWEKKVDSLIYRKDVLPFPNMRMINRESRLAREAKEAEELRNMEALIRARTPQKERYRRSLDKWEESKKLRGAPSYQSFGHKSEGELLRTIENYQGKKMCSLLWIETNRSRSIMKLHFLCFKFYFH